jgi:hypothetical protein
LVLAREQERTEYAARLEKGGMRDILTILSDNYSSQFDTTPFVENQFQIANRLTERQRMVSLKIKTVKTERDVNKKKNLFF